MSISRREIDEEGERNGNRTRAPRVEGEAEGEPGGGSGGRRREGGCGRAGGRLWRRTEHERSAAQFRAQLSSVRLSAL